MRGLLRLDWLGGTHLRWRVRLPHVPMLLQVRPHAGVVPHGPCHVLREDARVRGVTSISFV
jgi:hypothetical protein